MARYRTYDYRCSSCGHQAIELLDLSTDKDIEVRACPQCADHTFLKVPAMPVPMNQSYPDGQSRGEGYDLVKRAAKVEKQMYNLPPEKRKEHQREIATLRKAAHGKRDKNNG